MGQHKAIFMAKTFTKQYHITPKYYEYGFPSQESIVAERKGKELENKLVWQGEIDSPFLEKGSSLFIKELEVAVNVLSSMRSTDGSVIYQTDFNFDLVEDKDTIKSKTFAEKLLADHDAHIKEKYNNDTGLCITTKENWWQRFKGWVQNV